MADVSPYQIFPTVLYEFNYTPVDKIMMTSYIDQLKINTLKVPKKIIRKYGAVSYETCLSMVKNLNKIAKNNISV